MKPILQKIRELFSREDRRELTLEELREAVDRLLEAEAVKEASRVKGDGQAVYFSAGTEAEYEEWDKMQNKGWKKFYKKIFNLTGKNDTTIEQ